MSNAVNQRVRGAYGTMEGLGSVLGIDIQAVLQNAVQNAGGTASPASVPDPPALPSELDEEA